MRLGITLLACALVLPACAADEAMDDGEMAVEAMVEPMLGPVDGADLPGTDIERVQVGQSAPDFTLASLAGPNVTLSDYRGEKNVVLVFYRGHW